MFIKTPTELAPEEDQGACSRLVNAPRYATLDYTQALRRPDSRARPKDIPEIDDTFSIVGFGGGGQRLRRLRLKDWAERTRKTGGRSSRTSRAGSNKVAGVQALRLRAAVAAGRRRRPADPVCASSSIGDPGQVYEVAEEIKNKAQASGRFIVVQNSLAFDAPQVTRHHRPRPRGSAQRADQRYRHDARRCSSAAPRSRKFDRDNRSYDIITPGAAANSALNPERSASYFVRSVRRRDGAALGAWCSIETDASPAAIEQFNQLNSATISALPLPGVTTGDGLATIAADRPARCCRRASSSDYRRPVAAGDAARATPSLIAFGLAIIVIYLVLAAQFESFRDPLIIMMSVPLSIFGAMCRSISGLARSTSTRRSG